MLCISGIVDDVMFSHSGVNEPESKTIFRLFHQVAAPGTHQTMFFGDRVH